MATTYATAATAAGAWCCPLTLPPTPFEQVRATVTRVVRATSYPVAAIVYHDPVTELLLYRHPSRRRGTPDIRTCERTADALAAATGWTLNPDRAPDVGVLVGLGLREGYDPTGPHHEPGDVFAALSARTPPGAAWTGRKAQLISARLIDHTQVRWYDEAGVVVRAPGDLLPAIEEVAEVLRQHRFAVTDFDEGYTRTRAVRTHDTGDEHETSGDDDCLRRRADVPTVQRSKARRRERSR
ncbi:hypothetical protein [Actinocrispum wychmicini]|uniref:Uncharacterized protein n=1 Tax=Actinocrispum wychmicini TaxID=1213861 RepID=A0A4R2JC77_9PSEU|nr:hypothetical protein [Actinocrispum wychmicini]TCO57143.1 hypothetical protein EV192_106620 [Actinocrispum wychmicini]